MASLWNRIKIFGYYIMFFPAIVLHELAHATVAVLTGSKIVGFSFFPVANNKSVVFASVSVAPRNKVAAILIALAPFSLWGLALYIMFLYGFVAKSGNHYIFHYQEMLQLNKLHASYAVWQLYTGGFPSTHDVKVAAKSALFLLFAFVVAGIVLHFLGRI